MIDRFVALCLNRRQLVWLIVIAISVFGYMSWKALAIEAYPDIADVTSQVITQYPGHAAEEVEEQVTVPLERDLNGIPGLQVMRSHSTFGLSLITLVFRDGVDDYWARQRIQERIAGVDLPPNAVPGLDPLTSPIGEIYRYTLQSTFRDERELRELQEWVVIPRLKQVTGVADVTSFGGETTQFQLIVDPAKLAQYNVSLAQVTVAVQANNANAGREHRQSRRAGIRSAGNRVDSFSAGPGQHRDSGQERDTGLSQKSGDPAVGCTRTARDFREGQKSR